MVLLNRLHRNKIFHQVFFIDFSIVVFDLFLLKIYSVHGTPTIDVSSSPSPQSTYSPQSSPSESRTSPKVTSKIRSNSNLNDQFSMINNSRTTLSSTSAHVVSHHNDLPGIGGGIANSLNGKFIFM